MSFKDFTVIASMQTEDRSEGTTPVFDRTVSNQALEVQKAWERGCMHAWVVMVEGENAYLDGLLMT